MAFDEEKLSAFLDGELSPDETRSVEAALEADPALQRRLEDLMAADTLAQREFAAELDEAVPFALAAAIQGAPEAPSKPANSPEPVVTRRSSFGLIAASLAGALAIGGGAGFLAGQNTTPELASAGGGWLEDIADYHAIYAEQVRHLVEVPAEEAAHIETWLSATLETEVRIPDLSGKGLQFEGARLLVAAGRPVAQLVYTDGDRAVVALCQIQSNAPNTEFASRTINAFDMVTFGNDGSNFVVVGDAGRPDLRAIAEDAATQV
ncbi:anti-sigma factor [Gymnodinialimonas sp. 2305UL16-5]|uniref:anti-sigma factor family protein n=1 Tax=Gymnodinialimonas mytili TaxID=3126503 RepID=UPI0030A066AD